MKIEEIAAFWKKSGQLDRKTAEDLFRSKNYVGSLFFIHLFLEKILKGVVQQKTEKSPPFTHDLLILCKLANLALTKEQEGQLATINTFNIRARYADYKFSFYKKATKSYTQRYLNLAKELEAWFSNQY